MRAMTVTIALAVFGVVMPAQAETWDYRNESGSHTARISLTPGVPGPCTIRETSTGRETAPAKCTLIRSGSHVALKQDHGGGAVCLHFGQQVGHVISGIEFCTHGGPWQWSATVTP